MGVGECVNHVAGQKVYKTHVLSSVLFLCFIIWSSCNAVNNIANELEFCC